jgi:hypothetical protein
MRIEDEVKTDRHGYKNYHGLDPRPSKKPLKCALIQMCTFE